MPTIIDGLTGADRVAPGTVAPEDCSFGVAQVSSPAAINLTNQVSVDFTSVPSWAREISIAYRLVSTNGTSPLVVRVGDSTGLYTSNYDSQASSIQGASAASLFQASGFILEETSLAVYGRSGVSTLTRMGTSNNWAISTVLAVSNAANPRTSHSGGSIFLTGGPLDRLRITTLSGTDQFDAGVLSVLYKG